jgi:hypothetical protein
LKNFIEQRIIEAVRGLLTGRVNEVLRKGEFAVPAIELGNEGCDYAVYPAVILSTCERTEKERIIWLDTYLVTVSLSLPDTPESELRCYAYSGAVSRAIYENPTLSGIAERVVITGRKYISPKKVNCGDGWELFITLRVTVRGDN